MKINKSLVLSSILGLSVLFGTTAYAQSSEMITPRVFPGQILPVTQLASPKISNVDFEPNRGVGNIITLRGRPLITNEGIWVGPKLGLQGPQGLTGAKGDKGDRGATGAPGLNGAQGVQGPVGPTGLPGVAGAQGPAGAAGATGAVGPAGPTGLPGAPGAPGAPGVAGAAGKSVLNGSGNPDSSLGNDGDFYLDTASSIIYGPKNSGAWPSAGVSLIGATGAQGPQGVAGSQGPVGPTGLPGVAGAPGAQGPQGVAGPAGAIGPKGNDGAQGPAGSTGATGATGPQGPQGPAASVHVAANSDNSWGINTSVLSGDGSAGNPLSINGFGAQTGTAASGQSGAESTMGDIHLTASVVAGGMPCNGQLLPIQQYQALFSLIGTTYGGNGTTNFQLPDLRKQAPDHMTYYIIVNGVYPSRN